MNVLNILIGSVNFDQLLIKVVCEYVSCCWFWWLGGRVVGWLVGWLVGWVVGWLVGWFVGWLVGWFVGCLVGWCWLLFLVVGCCWFPFHDSLAFLWFSFGFSS